MSGRHAWLDVSAGVAGDMLLGALVDAGAPLPALQRAVDAVLPDAVTLVAREVRRAGQRACKVDVEVAGQDQPHRRWSDIEVMVRRADLPDRTRERVLAVFGRLAEAEARVHGIEVGQVHFHEVGALDSIADVVGLCAGLEALDVETVSAGPLAVGSGRVRTAHGSMGVPVPAVVELTHGWTVTAGGVGELATPTGTAAVVALAQRCEALPAGVLADAGVGAGSRDHPEQANTCRVLLLTPSTAAAGGVDEPVTVLEATVDDLDPRLWPGVLDTLLAAGALDTWLTPVLMKKGRPGHVVTVLARPDDVPVLQALLFAYTPTLGVRRAGWRRTALLRGWTDVEVAGAPVAVKVGHHDGLLRRATPEFVEVAALAHAQSRPAADVLAEAGAAAQAAGLVPGAPLPETLRAEQAR